MLKKLDVDDEYVMIHDLLLETDPEVSCQRFRQPPSDTGVLRQLPFCLENNYSGL